jgi:hypothetical protein
MPHVVDQKIVTVSPPMKIPDRPAPIVKKAARQIIARWLFGGKAEPMLHAQKEERLREERFPPDASL